MGGEPHFAVGRYDKTSLITAVQSQAALVSAALDNELPVFSALCLVDAGWNLLDPAIHFQGT